MKLALGKSQFLTPRILLLGLSFIAIAICVLAGAAHYRKAAWGDSWQPIAWLLSMLFLVVAFLPDRHALATCFKSLIERKTVFFLFWILFFIAAHLWNFRTAPWNGDALFDESGWDLWYLKSYVIGHPYQPAWFHAPISRETLFHYYVWGFLRLFGFNILAYEAALFGIWLTTYVFALLLVDLFFRSYIVTSATALIFNFLPFAFIYTFAGYRYPMATALAVTSLYFLHTGFKNKSAFWLSLGGIAAGLCLASSISGKQYLLALVIAAPLYAVFYWKNLKQSLDVVQSWIRRRMANRARPGPDGPNRSALFFPGAAVSLRSWSVFHSGFWQSNRAADQSTALSLFPLVSAKRKRIQLVPHSRDQTGLSAQYADAHPIPKRTSNSRASDRRL
jgi:hypothetical protein